jgi:hypothetical protein
MRKHSPEYYEQKKVIKVNKLKVIFYLIKKGKKLGFTFH